MLQFFAQLKKLLAMKIWKDLEIKTPLTNVMKTFIKQNEKCMKIQLSIYQPYNAEALAPLHTQKV
jgi:hypothetical protein